MSRFDSLPAPVRAVGETLVTLLVAVVIAYLAQAFVIKPYRVPSGSMIATLLPGDRVLADRISLRFKDPERYQIVVFHPPSCRAPFNGADGVCTSSRLDHRNGTADDTFIKRVIGLPGETLFTDPQNRVWARAPGERAHMLDEPYLNGAQTLNLDRVKVPEGYYFLMGDNRSNSADSRVWGPEPDDEILGIARARYWPLDRLGLL